MTWWIESVNPIMVEKEAYKKGDRTVSSKLPII